jgi:hypothetical protein
MACGDKSVRSRINQTVKVNRDGKVWTRCLTLEKRERSVKWPLLLKTTCATYRSTPFLDGDIFCWGLI